MRKDDVGPTLVLVVEGRPEIRSVLSEYLLSRGAVPVPATAGAHAEVVCQTLSPDLALINLPLPDTDGAALIRRIKDRRPDVVVTVCTPPDAALDARCLAHGADDVIRPPLDLIRVERALRQFRSRRRPA